jgi:hypothetical protein
MRMARLGKLKNNKKMKQLEPARSSPPGIHGGGAGSDLERD